MRDFRLKDFSVRLLIEGHLGSFCVLHGVGLDCLASIISTDFSTLGWIQPGRLLHLARHGHPRSVYCLILSLPPSLGCNRECGPKGNVRENEINGRNLCWNHLETASKLATTFCVSGNRLASLPSLGIVRPFPSHLEDIVMPF